MRRWRKKEIRGETRIVRGGREEQGGIRIEGGKTNGNKKKMDNEMDTDRRFDFLGT